MISILIAVLAISLLMVVHEAGHFVAARLLGMRVTDFSIGVGPAIMSYRAPGGDTTYAIRAIPFAAYVRIEGMAPPDHDEPQRTPDDPSLYRNKSVLARMAVNAAGPFANYAAASALIFGLALSGWPTAAPTASRPSGDLQQEQVLSVGEAAQKAIVLPAKLTVAQLQGMSDMIVRADSSGLTGPIGIGKVVADQAEQGTTALISVLVLISIGIGLFNLLPFPGLDGGKLAFLAYEAVSRRRPSIRFEMAAHATGLLLLLGMIALVTARDILG